MILSILTAMTLVPKSSEVFYIGTYTKPGASQGIYVSSLEPSTGKLGEPRLAAHAENPSYVAIHPNGKSVYAVLEFTGGDVAAYRTLDDGGLELLNKQSWQGGGPCHVSVDPEGRYLLASAYGQGSVGCFPIEKGGRLGPVSSSFQNRGSGPNSTRQEGPHMHSAYFAGGKALACDLGTDQILLFDFDRGQLSPTSFFSTEPGGGPRHLAFHPNGKAVYANLEMGNAVCAFRWDGVKLVWTQTQKTLPPGTDETGKTTAAIACHPSGKHLYVSNRGHDSIAVFAISADGRMKLVEIASAGVKEPRGMALDRSGKWLVVAGQNSDDVVSLRIDGKTGRLSKPISRIHVGSPVCIAFR